MAFFRCCFTTVVAVLCLLNTNAQQTIYYPANSSSLLKNTADDVAQLFNKAITNGNINAVPYTSMPQQGIIFVYDSTVVGNMQTCIVKCSATNVIFRAAEDNGLVFGVYQYLQKLGFKFYQPGIAWEIVPSLITPYKTIDTIFTNNYKYRGWFVSGGSNRWIMDNDNKYNWDRYFGQNGHQLALYQRRNGMLGQYGFAGHRGDINTGNYLSTLQSNPCYVAAYNGERKPNAQSVPDIFNVDAVNMWANTIEQKYTASVNSIKNNPTLYINQFRNFKTATDNIGIEVPDAAQWGNSTAALNCNAQNYPSESDQQFTLANKTATAISTKYKDKQFQVYAYSTHANVPSANIAINKNIDVQLIPTVYQLETSTNGIRNRWLNKHTNLSEYHYLNLTNWSGELPSFSWKELEQTLQIAKAKKMQGLFWEASPAKFASLPYLMAANNFMKEDMPVNESLKKYSADLFGNASETIFEILQLFGNKNSAPSKYNLQLYFNLLLKVEEQVKNDNEIIKQRVAELKAYFHYTVLYFNAINTSLTTQQKIDADAAMCMYVAKTNKLLLVNSYYIIFSIANKYGVGSAFYEKYNPQTGTAYLNGALPLITANEIEQNFKEDIVSSSSILATNFVYKNESFIQQKLQEHSLVPIEKITTQIEYSNGLNYYNKSVFKIVAPQKGSFSINYAPRFDDATKGYINFLIESANEEFLVLKDVILTKTDKAGQLKVELPKAGNYMFTICTKYKSALQLSITTNNNYFYKENFSFSSKIEKYERNSLPQFFYVPSNISKLFFTSSANSSSTILSNFNIKANTVTPKDAYLFYTNVTNNAMGSFWQVTPKENTHSFSLVNTNNIYWFVKQSANSKPSTNANVENISSKPIMFPNPSNGEYKINNSNNNLAVVNTIEVFNTQGSRVAVFGNTNKINITNLAAGMYTYKILLNGNTHFGKLIKQ